MPRNILMPAFAAGVDEATIVRWLKVVGDRVTKGETIAEIETDKAVVELAADVDGILGTIVAVAGSIAPVNSTIAVLFLAGESAQRSMTNDGLIASKDPLGAAENIPTRSASEPQLSLATSSAANVSADDDDGPGVPHRTVPHSNIRRVIAHRLTAAKATVPHFYISAECNIDALSDMRSRLNQHADAGSKLSLNDFMIKAAALALKKVPSANVSWTDDALLIYERIDISVAVATDAGVITPIVRDAERKPLQEISSEVRRLAAQAKGGKLQPIDYQGGSFTVSNLGMYGIHSFAAIINPPQSCILAIGAGERRCVVIGNVCTPASVMSCTLSVDHRSVDGVVGAQYVQTFKALVEQPHLLML